MLALINSTMAPRAEDDVLRDENEILGLIGGETVRAEVPDFIGGNGLARDSVVGFGARLCDAHHGPHGHRGHSRRVDFWTQLARCAGAFHQLCEQRQQRCVGCLNLGRMRHQQPRREIREQGPPRGGVRPGRLEQ